MLKRILKHYQKQPLTRKYRYINNDTGELFVNLLHAIVNCIYYKEPLNISKFKD